MNTTQRPSREFSRPSRDGSSVQDPASRVDDRPEVSGYPEIPAEDWLKRIGEMARLVSPRRTAATGDRPQGV